MQDYTTTHTHPSEADSRCNELTIPGFCHHIPTTGHPRAAQPTWHGTVMYAAITTGTTLTGQTTEIAAPKDWFLLAAAACITAYTAAVIAEGTIPTRGTTP